MSLMSAPIGLVDSGVGCFTVLPALRRRMPAESWLVLQDREYAPYGQLSDDCILDRSFSVIKRLQANGAKAVLLACHTSSALALDKLGAMFSIPVFGVLEPTALGLSRTASQQRVLWLATTASIRANRLPLLCHEYGFTGELLPLACPGWVDAIEAGSWTKPRFASQINRLIRTHNQGGQAEFTSVLYGCTHYPWLEPILANILGVDVHRINPADWIADYVQANIADLGLQATGADIGRVQVMDSAAIPKTWQQYFQRQDTPALEWL